MTRRIIIINEHAPTLDVREGIRKVPAHALRQGDVTSANGERVVSAKRANDSADRIDVVLAKNGLRRYLQWHRDVMVGVAVRDKDGVGTPEEVAYGEGWHSTQRGSPYDDPALIAAWERGRKAKQQQSKMTNGYFRGELRNKRVDPPRARQQDDAFSEASTEKLKELLLLAHVMVKQFENPKTQGDIRSYELAKKNLARVEEELRKRSGARDFKSEKGYVAKLIDVRTGGVLARSEPHISNGVGLKAWVQTKARELIAQGKRVKAEIGIEFYDPNLMHDDAL